MKNIIMLLAGLLLLKCNTVNITQGKCNKEYAKQIADNTMKKKGYNIKLLNRSVEETDDLYIIDYSSKDTTTLGNGAQIKISKNNCKIKELKLYQ